MYRYLLCVTFFLSPAALAQAPYPQGQTYRMVGPVVDFPTQAVSLSVAVIGVPFRLHYRSGGGERMWSWSVHHAYYPAGEMLSLGDGRWKPASPLFRHWATDATASSEYGSQDYSAKQATGKPDTSTHADAKTAWAPRIQDGTTEWLELTYERAVKPAAINIRETFNPGFVTKVEAYNADGAQWHVLWQGKDPTTKESMVFSPPLSKATFTTKRIRLTIDTNVPGWNEIDAVELVAQSPPWLSAGEVAIVAPNGREVYVFNNGGRHLRTLNAFTRALLWRFAYNGAGGLIAIEDGFGNVTRIERNANGVATAVIAPYGQRSILRTGADGYLASITNPANETTSLSYSGAGHLVALTDPRGSVYRFTVDAQGYVTKQEDPAGGFLDLKRTLTDKGYKVSSKTAMGRESGYMADRLSDGEANVVTTDPGSSEMRLRVLANGTAAVAYSDGRTLTRTQQPDPRWGPQSPLLNTVSIATPGGLTSALSLNRAVALADSSDPLSLTTLTDTTRINGQTYTRTFDASRKQLSSVSPAGRRTITNFDDRGRIVKAEVPGLLPMAFTFDGRGRLTTFTQGTGTDARAGRVGYNAKGEIAAVTDSLKRTVRLEYDPAGRISKRTLPNGREIILKYDANGNMTAITPPGRPAHSFDYTSLSVIQSYRPPHVEQAVGDTGYVCNKDGQLNKILRADATATEFTYDTAGRVSAVTGPGVQTLFGYAPKTTHLTAITATDGGVLSHTYDGSLLSQATWTGTVKGTVRFTYNSNLLTASMSVNGEPPIKREYDPDRLLTQAGVLALRRDHRNGLLAATVLGNVATTQEYNGFGELKLVRAVFKDREIFTEQYERDALGRIVRKNETVDGQARAYAYTYDGAGRLINVTRDGIRTAHYEYDANGNRMMSAGLNGTVKASYDAQDRLRQYGQAAYAHTANGEWSGKTIEGETTTYSYDVLGNLKATSLPDGTKIDYVVDGANRRIGKKINGKLVQGFLYQDQLKVIVELDGENQVVTRFVYSAMSNVPDYMTKGGKIYRILTDLLGSPRIVIDADTGVIAQRVDYDEFGNMLRDTNPGFQPFGFSGGLYDIHTKLVRFGARDYDGFTGRWTAKDPILFAGGQTNAYAYVSNSPVTLRDQSGLAELRIGPFPLTPSVIDIATAWGIVRDTGILWRGGNPTYFPGEGWGFPVPPDASPGAFEAAAEAAEQSPALASVTGETAESLFLPAEVPVFDAVLASAVIGVAAGMAIDWTYQNYISSAGQSLGEDWADINLGGGERFGDWWYQRNPFGPDDRSEGCPEGQFRHRTGECDCPSHFAWNPLNQKCECALSCDTAATAFATLDRAACKCVCDECCERSRKAGMAVCGGQPR